MPIEIDVQTMNVMVFEVFEEKYNIVKNKTKNCTVCSFTCFMTKN